MEGSRWPQVAPSVDCSTQLLPPLALQAQRSASASHAVASPVQKPGALAAELRRFTGDQWEINGAQALHRSW